MSRIGKHPIAVPAEVSVTIEAGNVVTVKGPKGTLTQTFHPDMIIKQENGVLTVSRPDDEHLHKSLHGLTRTLLYNMVVGVEKGYNKELDIVGVGYRAEKKGNQLVMSLGFSHPVVVDEDPRHHHRRARRQQGCHSRHRQAGRRSVCRRGSRKETSRTLQGQGRQILHRGYPPEGG